MEAYLLLKDYQVQKEQGQALGFSIMSSLITNLSWFRTISIWALLYFYASWVAVECF